MENYNFLDFTKEHYPEIWQEFYRYKRKDNPPAIGTEVITLVHGHNDYAGVTRYIVAHDERYIHLGHVPNGKATSLCEIKDWWTELKIINEPDKLEVD